MVGWVGGARTYRVEEQPRREAAGAAARACGVARGRREGEGLGTTAAAPLSTGLEKDFVHARQRANFEVLWSFRLVLSRSCPAVVAGSPLG